MRASCRPGWAAARAVAMAGLILASIPEALAFQSSSPPISFAGSPRNLPLTSGTSGDKSVRRLRGGGGVEDSEHARNVGAEIRIGVMSGGGEGDGKVRQKFYSFEGLIGAGKTTLLRKLEERGVAIIPEPLDRWQRSGIFEAFYKDMTRWSFTFQMSAYITRVGSVEDAMSKASSTRRFIGERSWCSDAYVFEPLLYRDGHISEMEHHAYQEWWRYLEGKAPEVHGVIYLRASPETCHRRIMKRQRSEEAAIPLGYLAGLHQQHERWLVKHETGYGPVSERETPVLILDADQEFETDAAVLDQFVDQILAFIQ